MTSIKKVCVIGSGVMGSGIAAQVANSRTNVILLDIVDEVSDNPSNIAKTAFSNMLVSKPAPLSHPSLAKYITTGNLRDDLGLIKDCDLIIEVIVEKLEVKHSLYERLIPYIKENAIIASNTSTLPLAKLKEKLPQGIKNRFIITHFFNPPRYMELLEMVSDESNDKILLENCREFISKKLGKTIIPCNDTPGFIANRIGCFLLEMTTRKAIEKKLDPVVIDQIFTKLLGFPSTGIFGLYDLIGHDVMALITKSLTNSLRSDDKYHEICRDSHVLSTLKSKGFLGRKSGAGFYKVTKSESKTDKQIFDFNTLDYVGIKHVELPKTLEELFNKGDSYSSFFKDTLTIFLSYVTNLIPEISDSHHDIDEAMKLGYSLKYGPFELLKLLQKNIDGLRAIKAGNISPIASETSWQEAAKLILSNDSADLLEYKNNHIFVIKTKMNSLNHDVFKLIIDSIKYSEDKDKRLIIHPGKSKHYSVGADLRLFSEMINSKNFKNMEEFIDLGQKAMMALKYAKIDVISCAYGLALGGGCELLLHSHKVIAHQNLTAGLVELGVGLVPGWGGVKEMFLRGSSNEERLVENLQNILMQYRSTSGDYFAEKYRVDYNFNMNINNIMNEALELGEASRSGLQQATRFIELPKIDLASKMDTANLDKVTQNVLKFFQDIIDMGKVDEITLLNMEKEQFIKMAKEPECAKRISLLLA